MESVWELTLAPKSKIAPTTSFTINEVDPKPIGNGWHAIFPGEKVLVEVNWGLMDGFPEDGETWDVPPGQEVRIQVRWCTESGMQRAKGSPARHSVENIDKPFQNDKSVTLTPKPPLRDETIADPLTMAGQQPGAILFIKRMPHDAQNMDLGRQHLKPWLEVGDCVEVLRTCVTT